MKRNEREPNHNAPNVQTSTTIFHTAKNGIDIAFENITYKVTIVKNKKKYINLPWKKKT